MKKYFLGLAGFALLGGAPLLGQGPPPIPPGPVGGPVVHGPDGGCAHGHCAPPTKTICVPDHYIKKTDHWCYSSGCEPLCLCYYHGLFRHCGCGEHGHCEHPYTRRYQIKKLRVEESECTRCVPKEVPDCGHGHHRSRGHDGAADCLPGVVAPGAPLIPPPGTAPPPPCAPPTAPAPIGRPTP
jgi:hypothetical protein